MGQKIKHRQERKPKSPRNYAARDMILSSGKGGTHSDKRKRRNRQETSWKNEQD